MRYGRLLGLEDAEFEVVGVDCVSAGLLGNMHVGFYLGWAEW